MQIILRDTLLEKISVFWRRKIGSLKDGYTTYKNTSRLSQHFLDGYNNSTRTPVGADKVML